MTLLTLEDFVGFKCSTFDVGQSNNGRSRMTDANLEPCP